MEVKIMLHHTARLFIANALILAAITISHSQSRQSWPNGSSQLQNVQQPSITIENPQSAPLLLRLISVEAMPDRPKMVKIILQVKAKEVAPLKSYSVHYEEAWKDKESGDGTLVSDMTSGNQPPHEISFIARQNGKVILWVSAVVYTDGSEWKSRLSSSQQKK
jgi:hypothetical protein